MANVVITLNPMHPAAAVDLPTLQRAGRQWQRRAPNVIDVSELTLEVLQAGELLIDGLSVEERFGEARPLPVAEAPPPVRTVRGSLPPSGASGPTRSISTPVFRE